MDRKLPVPLRKAFLVCKEIIEDSLTRFDNANCYVNHILPSTYPLAVFYQLINGHGEVTIEVQLRDENGVVVWRDGPDDPWFPESPLEILEGSLTFTLVFPGPGEYSIVLTANGEELDREPFTPQLSLHDAGT